MPKTVEISTLSCNVSIFRLSKNPKKMQYHFRLGRKKNCNDSCTFCDFDTKTNNLQHRKNVTFSKRPPGEFAYAEACFWAAPAGLFIAGRSPGTRWRACRGSKNNRGTTAHGRTESRQARSGCRPRRRWGTSHGGLRTRVCLRFGSLGGGWARAGAHAQP